MAATTVEPELTMPECVEAMLKILKKLVCDLATRYPSDDVIIRAKKRVMLAAQEAPVDVVDVVGGYLYRFREKILANDTTFFLDKNYDAELREGTDAEKVDMSAYIIPKVKDSWRGSDAATRIEYEDTIQDFLYIYLDFLAWEVIRRG